MYFLKTILLSGLSSSMCFYLILLQKKCPHTPTTFFKRDETEQQIKFQNHILNGHSNCQMSQQSTVNCFMV